MHFIYTSLAEAPFRRFQMQLTKMMLVRRLKAIGDETLFDKMHSKSRAITETYVS